jgi:predicted GNAT family N-acyltransferase
VFCGEQGVARAAERDGRDREAAHVVALDGAELVGTCRLVVSGGVAQLGRMAVEPERRGGGIGTAVLREAERSARAAGCGRIALHAQTHAQGLYERDGYRPRGEVFIEEGIEHVAMEKPLA